MKPLKNIYSITFYIFLLMLLVFACTKEVDLITIVEFELIDEHPDDGFVNQALPTTLTVIPEAEMEGYEYFFTYTVTNGEGHLENSNGEMYLPNEKIPLDSLTVSMIYKGTAKGENTLKIEEGDNFGLTEETTLTYSIDDVPVTWSVTSPVTEVELGKIAPISITLDSTQQSDVVYEYKYVITANSVTADDASDTYVPKLPVATTYLLPQIHSALYR